MKSKLFPLITILTLIVLLGTAAICNRCGNNLTTDTTTSDSIENETVETSDETAAEEETVAANTQEEDTDTTQSSQVDTDKKAPTIKLEISAGPTYSAADDVCWWRVEATVTGSPAPRVTWSQDVSNSSFGKNIAQVNLTRDNPDYTLTATATNSEGTATDDIDLSWGCDGEETVEEEDNNSPIIETIAVNENEINESDEVRVVTGGYLNFVVIASDEDDDELTYSAYDNIGNNLEITKLDNTLCGFSWLAPLDPGLYELTIKVEDGNGGDDNAVIHITVNAAANNPPEILGNISVWNLPGDDTPIGGPYKAGQVHYRVLVDVSDPDGDPLTFNWDGGGAYGYTDRHANPTEWITPDGASIYYIHVTVKDGRGGEAETGINVTVAE